MDNIICHNVIDVTEKGITLEYQKKRIFVHFDDCAKNFSAEKGNEFSRCVATRDITTLSFVFYADPRIRVVFKKHFFKELFSGKTAVGRFLKLQQAINKYGYTSYDLS